MSRHSHRKAFTVTEMLVAIALMSLIVFSLYSVFNQTQRALRNTETQSDVSEKGRAVLELVTRELEQMTPSFSRGEFNLYNLVDSSPATQSDMDTSSQVRPRTNVLHGVLFLTHPTNAWASIGYRIDGSSNGVGTLQRFSSYIVGRQPASNSFLLNFIREPSTSTNFHLISEGIVHFRLVPYDPEGRRLGFNTTNTHPNYSIWRVNSAGQTLAENPQGARTNYNVLLRQSTASDAYETQFTFLSNALPSYLELELGVLEPDTLKQYNQLLADQPGTAKSFLARRISKVHLFRQRIPIRTAAQ